MRLTNVVVPVLCILVTIGMMATYPITEQIATDVL